MIGGRLPSPTLPNPFRSRPAHSPLNRVFGRTYSGWSQRLQWQSTLPCSMYLTGWVTRYYTHFTDHYCRTLSQASLTVFIPKKATFPDGVNRPTLLEPKVVHSVGTTEIMRLRIENRRQPIGGGSRCRDWSSFRSTARSYRPLQRLLTPRVLSPDQYLLVPHCSILPGGLTLREAHWTISKSSHL